jgi:hypothetical protein
MTFPGRIRLPQPPFLSLVVLGLALIAPAVAGASSLAVSGATRSGGFYPWCGQTLLGDLLPDATPPGAPTSCGDYSGPGSSGTLVAQLGPHGAGTLIASLYVHDDARPLTLSLYLDGAQVGASVTAPQRRGGWLSFPAVAVAAASAISVQVRSGAGGSGYVKVYAVHATLTPVATVLGQPGNWAATPIPSGVALDPGRAPDGTALTRAVPRELAGQAAADSWVNQTAYTAKIFYVPLNTPLQPVRLCRYSGACVPNWGTGADDLWRAAMGEGNAATFNRVTGKPTSDQYIAGGLPLTSAVTPSPGRDREAVICRGGGDSGTPPWVARNADGTVFTRLDGQPIEGNCWEVWGLRPDPTYDPSGPVSPSNTMWMIQWGARRTGFITQLGGAPVSITDPLDTLSGTYTRPRDPSWYGPDVATPGAADSTTYDPVWGVTAARTTLLTDIVRQSDCQAVLDGAADFGHAIGIQLQYTRDPLTAGATAWWPAGSSDGTAPSVATVEGMRVFFGPALAIPSSLSAAGRALFHTLQRYGAVIDDTTMGGPPIANAPDGAYQSGGALMIRSELDTTGAGPCHQLGIATALAGIPWAQISGPIKMGSDTDPNPT